jgi:hypothetical protein
VTTDIIIPESVAIARPDPEALRRGAASALAMAETFEVVDAATYELAAEELRAIKAKASALDERRKAITGPLDVAKKAVMDLFRGPLDVLAQAEASLKRSMLSYSQEQARIAEQARREAESRAAAERARIAEEARRAEEAAAAAREAGQKAAAELRVAQDDAERERLAAEAASQAAEAARLSSEAQMQQRAASMVVAAAPSAAVAVPKASGVSTATSIDFEVVDLLALVKAAAERPELVALLAVDSVKLRAYVRGLGLQCNLPGVRVFQKQTLASRKG